MSTITTEDVTDFARKMAVFFIETPNLGAFAQNWRDKRSVMTMIEGMHRHVSQHMEEAVPGYFKVRDALLEMSPNDEVFQAHIDRIVSILTEYR